MRNEIELICAIDIEQTAESFHAHAIPQDVEINAGDMILVHDAPTTIGFGQSYIGQRRATLMRAGLLRRVWTRISSIFEVTELFEVGFQPIADATNLKG
jgi:hypothetical protein